MNEKNPSSIFNDESSPTTGGCRQAERWRQLRFVAEYVGDHQRNATRAAIRAGYSPGPNNSSAAVTASRLLKKAKIQKLIKDKEQELRSDDALARKLARLEAIIHTNFTDIVSWDSHGRLTLKPSSALSPAAAAAVATITEFSDDGQGRLPLGDLDEALANKIRRSVRLHDPLRALDMYFKITGAYSAEKLELSGDLYERLLRARAKGSQDDETL